MRRLKFNFIKISCVTYKAHSTPSLREVLEAVRKGTDRPDPLSLLAGNSMTIRYWQNVCYIQCAVSGNRIATPSLTVCAEWPPTPILLRKTLWHIGFLVGNRGRESGFARSPSLQTG